MFYNDTFVGNHEEILVADITEAKTLNELEGLINAITKTLWTFDQYNGPEMLKEVYNKRLAEVISYYRSMGGSI